MIAAIDRGKCDDLKRRGYRVVRYDNRDVGVSHNLGEADPANIQQSMADMVAKRPVTAAYTLEDMAATGLLDALGIASAHISRCIDVGHDRADGRCPSSHKARSLTSIMSATGACRQRSRKQ